MGGMAELFVATAPGEHGFQKKVVIKRLLPHLSPDETYKAMFIDEAKLTARLIHPKIAQTFELGRVEDSLFIAMEFVDGIDVLALLREFAARRRRVDPALAAWIAHGPAIVRGGERARCLAHGARRQAVALRQVRRRHRARAGRDRSQGAQEVSRGALVGLGGVSRRARGMAVRATQADHAAPGRR